MADPAPDGIEARWRDAFGEQRRVDPEVRAALRAAIGLESAGSTPLDPVRLAAPGEALPAGAELVLEGGTALGALQRLPRDVPFGYHRLRQQHGEQLLILPPPRCHLPDSLRAWGWAVQLYAARSRQSWGIGDLGDLRRLAAWSASLGAGVLLTSPLGAPNPDPDPDPSPYYPSSRRFRDPLTLRVEAMAGYSDVAAELERLAAEARRLNPSRQIDRARVGDLKRRAFDQIWRAAGRGATADPAFARYRAEMGPALRQWATYAALAERHGAAWGRWPVELQDPGSAAVARFAAEAAERVALHEWLQWQLDEQLAAAAAPLPLIGDLPVGFHPDGFDAWSWQGLLADGARIGAPPDRFNPAGQDWALPPFVPHRLRAAAYAPIIETLRAAMRHAGGLRIDHVLGLFRLWWIPRGGDPSRGAYVRYHGDELAAILAIESRRAGAIVIGEDLGTVQPGVRRALAARSILSTRLVLFERRAPHRYPRRTHAAVTTHDLPTVAGCWSGADLADQVAAGLSPDRAGLEALRRRLAGVAGLGRHTAVEAVVLALHRSLATAPSALVTATLEDALRVERRPNLPGTTRSQRANWSEALPAALEELEADPFVRELAEALRR
jgi:4-alpha-glucanotransferase